MANKVKTTKAKAAAVDTLKQEKEETVEVKELLKDERTHKIAGSICILIAILFFLAFTSYLFTWDEDQSIVKDAGSELLLGTDAKVSNLMGTFGAYISHFFIYKGFGVASYLLCSFFFVVGVNLFFGKKIFSVIRNIKYLIIGLPLLSTTASVIMRGNEFAWGGAVGDLCKNYLFTSIGFLGTVLLIGFSFLAYVIWRFNPSFKPSPKKTIAAAPVELEEEGEDDESDEIADEDEEHASTIKANALKGNAGMMNDVPDQSPKFNHELTIIEKAEEPIAKQPNIKTVQPNLEPSFIDNDADEIIQPVILPKTVPPPPVIDTSGLELEIKVADISLHDDLPVTSPEKVQQLKPYDPILDL
ncbi:MAG TPA: DNA translocase FtsK 4TM domain-containing protein, partial [Ferruginibacter sp.]|nr:DNA translocase FtsK 4TM domain-containing protein [Ferruginibacter sp.]